MMTWPEAMGLVVIDGLVIVVLAVTGFRTAVFTAVPPALKSAIAVGIGAFIALIGLVDAGFVRRLPDAANTTLPVGLGIGGSIASWPTAVFVLGLLITGVLVVRGVRAGLLLGVEITTVIAIVVEAIAQVGSSATNPDGWALSVPRLPDSIVGLPDLSLVGDVSFGAFARLDVLTVVLLIFTLVLANFFDALGAMTPLGRQAGLTDGQLPNVGKALVVEGAGAVAGGLGSASSNTVFVESASGIAEAMMFRQVDGIDLSDLRTALPAFLTVVVMPFTYSIANGIGAGFITYVLLAATTGRARTVHPLMWVVAVAFVGYFAIGPLRSLL